MKASPHVGAAQVAAMTEKLVRPSGFQGLPQDAAVAAIIVPPSREGIPMTIQIGDPIPSASLHVLKDGVQAISTDEIFGGRKVVLFSVPGAFTPTCSARHLPGYIEHFEDFRKRGVDVACIAVNDAYVMDAWAKTQNVPEGLMMLADGNGAFAQLLGLEMDASRFGMGVRGKRFALYAEDGIVKKLAVEAPGEFTVSDAQSMLSTIA
jgi:peroxiredoxin